MMANNYESLKTDGHYTMARRIFQKVKGIFVQSVGYFIHYDENDEILGIGFTQTRGNYVDIYLYLTKGDNVKFESSSINSEIVILADQIEDTYNYTQYDALPSTTKQLDKLFIVDDAPAPVFFSYDAQTKSIIFTNGYASYDEDTKTVTIGG